MDKRQRNLSGRTNTAIEIFRRMQVLEIEAETLERKLRVAIPLIPSKELWTYFDITRKITLLSNYQKEKANE